MVKSLNARTVEACKFSLNLIEEALYEVDDGGATGNSIPEKRSRLVDDLSVMLKVPDRERTVITVESEKQGHRRGRGKRRRLGVSRGKGDYWTAAIEDKQSKNKIFLGDSYRTEREAEDSYDSLARALQGRLASLNNATPMDIRRQQSALRVLKYYGLDNLIEDDRDPTERDGRKPCGLCLDDPSICLCVACGCGRCFGKHYAEDALLCDSVINNECDSEWHMQCLIPPLLHIPNGKWYCPECVRERGRGVQCKRGKQLASPTASPIHKEKDNGGCIPQKRVYHPRYSISSAVKLVRDIASREISDKEVQLFDSVAEEGDVKHIKCILEAIEEERTKLLNKIRDLTTMVEKEKHGKEQLR
eukprot:69923_1